MTLESLPAVRAVHASVEGCVSLGAGLTEKSRGRLRRALSYINLVYLRATRMGRHPGTEPERLEATIERPDGTLLCPRGADKVIREQLGKDGFVPKWYDARTLGSPLTLDPAVIARVAKECRDYQREGARAVRTHFQGSIVLPCGGGKTRLGGAAIAAVGRNTLILAHTDDLLDQWVEMLRATLGIEAGILNPAGARARLESDDMPPEPPVVVASIWTLDELLKKRPIWSYQFGFVILDEAHHCPAVTFQRVLMQIPCKYRLGLTATPDREDGGTRLIDWSFGPRLLEKDTIELIAKGYLMKPDVRYVETNFEYDHKGPEKTRISKMEQALALDRNRNLQIARLAAEEGLAGESVLVLANRKTLCKKLGGLIADKGCPARILTSATDKNTRKRTISALREGDANVVIATSLADEGLDIQRLSRILLVWPERAKGRTMQRVGRLMRKYDKTPILYDFLDVHVETLRSRAEARKRTYKKLGLLR